MSKLTTIVAILCCLLTLGCSEDETTTAAAPGVLTFVSDDVPAGPAGFLRAGALSPQHLTLEVVGQQLPDTYGVALRLEYSGDVLSYDGLAPGAAWDGRITLPIGREVAPGLLVAAVTLRGDSAGVAVDDDVIAVLELPLFTVAPTQVQLSERDCAVVAGDGTEVGGVSWSGGQLVVQ